MEGLTRLVAESLARHGFDRPLDYRRLHWSRWFRCESHHSLLFVPSRPGVFAIAQEIMNDAGAADAPVRPVSEASGTFPISGAEAESRKPAAEPRRMLAVTQFFEADDMAFVLDRMLSRPNPMQARLASGRYFVRFVVIEEASQRRTISSALNQWMISAAEKATGIGAHFSTSLELTPATEYIPPAKDAQPTLFDNSAAAPSASKISDSPAAPNLKPAAPCITAPQFDSGAAANIHRPSPFPSGF
jgi:hypothetical protein